MRGVRLARLALCPRHRASQTKVSQMPMTPEQALAAFDPEADREAEYDAEVAPLVLKVGYAPMRLAVTMSILPGSHSALYATAELLDGVYIAPAGSDDDEGNN